jgi:hypothetical protein
MVEQRAKGARADVLTADEPQPILFERNPAGSRSGG